MSIGPTAHAKDKSELFAWITAQISVGDSRQGEHVVVEVLVYFSYYLEGRYCGYNALQ